MKTGPHVVNSSVQTFFRNLAVSSRVFCDHVMHVMQQKFTQKSRQDRN